MRATSGGWVRVTLLVVMAALSVGVGWAAEKPGPPYVTLNGKAMTTSKALPLLLDGQVLVDLGDLLAAIGGDVSADAGGTKLTIDRAETVVHLQVGDRGYRIGGQSRVLAVAPFPMGSAMYVPARDLVMAFGGEYRWDPGALTADLRIEPMGIVARVVKGSLVHYDTQAPPFFLVKAEGADRATQFWGATGIRYQRPGKDGSLQPAALKDFKPGDSVEVGLDEAGKVVRLVSAGNLVEGTLDWVGEGTVLLTDRSFYYLGRDVVVVAANGAPYRLEDLKQGQAVTLTVDPADRSVTRISLAAAEQGGATQEPKIFGVTVENAGPLRAGRAVIVRMNATPGGTGTFDIGEQFRALPMAEVGPGEYQGQYIVRDGDSGTGARVSATLRMGARTVAPVAAADLVSFDTVAPRFVSTSPSNGEMTRNASPTLLVRYDDGQGSGVDPTATTLAVDGREVHGDATVDEQGAFYQAERLAAGEHRVEARISDKAGNESRLSFSFVVDIGTPNRILTVQHDARRVLIAQDVLTVTMEVQEPGREASFTIGDDWRTVAMAPVPDTNLYRGQYVVRADDEVADARVVGRFVDDTGTVYSLAATTLVSIARGLPDRLTITEPTDGAKVTADTIEVKGTAPPNRRVRILVQYEFIFGTKTLYRAVATSDDRGGFGSKPVDLRKGLVESLFATDFTITAQLLDDAGAVQETAKVTISVADEQ